ncbi:MAG TPA: hypothetical protein VK789_28240 [Bryobacteraceae bacterium]|jgi:hypothetical protein|nr:hypothetical protein [Bryobacteraceae bacterium]
MPKVHFLRNAFDPKGYVATTVTPPPPYRVEDSLNMAYARFNRGSGEEIDFEGPSASVGDYFMIENPAGVECHRVATMGFEFIGAIPVDLTQSRD